MTRPDLFTLLLLLALGLIAGPGWSQTSEMTTAQRQALAEGGDEQELINPKRPAKLPDLTKGELVGKRFEQHSWHLGPTGIIGYMPGGLAGDQIQVTSVLKGAPAQGKLQWGDVILAVDGQRFVAGQNMGKLFGDAIIKAEREVNKGILKLRVWRDLNFVKRNQKQDIAGTDIDRLIEKTVSDDTLYEWKSSEGQEAEASSPNYKEFPIQPQVFEVTLELATLPDYTDTSPYDCPKAAAILENAWKVLEKQFKVDKRGKGGRGGTIQAVALAASGKPEHRKLLAEWVRSPRGKIWHPPTKPDDPMRIPGKSWYMSFTGLDCALYYDATGDEFVLPALKRFAVRTALGQSGMGTWGHNWAQPTWNGGSYHGMNPGYGALNASGNRCFFLLVLADKLGIEHPEISAAIRRSQRFFSSYIDKGAIPYGHHSAWPSDDSNGKNSGVAHALKLLGDKHGAKYFAQMCAHASFTRRGGHGHDWFWHWSPLGATIAGPRGTIAAHRNLRWWFTLCRRFDGGFVVHSPTGAGTLRDPTATYVLHYSTPLKQTLITGKDSDESLWFTDEEYQKFLTMAQGQFFDQTLKKQAGPPVHQRSTDEVFKHLDVFKPKTRHNYARELGKRYKAGEKEILARLAAMLESDEPRERDAACVALAACGADATLKYMSGVARLLQDDAEFVRMQAARTMAGASNDPDTHRALLKATVAENTAKTMSPNSLPAVTQSLLFGNKTKLAVSPFDAGFDETLVRDALEALLTLDPAGNRPMIRSTKDIWTKDTVVRVAGPLVFAAEEEQIGDQMFSSRRPNSLALLERLGYHEAIEASVSYLRKYRELPRDIRPRVYFKRGEVEAKTLLRHPAVAKQYLDWLKLWLADKPLVMAFAAKEEPNIPLYQLIDTLEKSKATKTLPRLADEAERFYQRQLDAAESDEKRIAMCRADLANPAGRDFFRKIAAMRYLAKTLGKGAMGDLLPYLGHEHWRVRETAEQLAAELAKAGGEAALIDAFAHADEAQARGILAVLAMARAGGSALAKQALKHENVEVRAEAVQALFAIAGDEAFDTVFAFIENARHAAELRGAEKALLSRREDSQYADRVRGKAIALLPDASPQLRESLYWLLGQLGGPKAMAVLKQGVESENDATFSAAVNALAFSPDLAADNVLLGVIQLGSKSSRAQHAARHGMRRMVIGPDGLGTRSVEKQLDWAEGVLNSVLDDSTITYLGRIRTGRCAFILQRAMRRGAPATAAKAIIVATSDLSGAPEKDRKLAVSALIDTIEFIEVNYLRGGVSGQLKKNPEAWRYYPKWKAISAQAGKNLLRLNKTDQAPLPTFDDNDLDL